MYSHLSAPPALSSTDVTCPEEEIFSPSAALLSAPHPGALDLPLPDLLAAHPMQAGWRMPPKKMLPGQRIIQEIITPRHRGLRGAGRDCRRVSASRQKNKGQPAESKTSFATSSRFDVVSGG
jgi:hypothetical protein